MGLDLVTCIIALIVMGFCSWWVIRWFFKIGNNHAKKSDLLSPSDLAVLEDTTKRLMDDLKAVTDDCVSRIDQACQDAENRIAAAQNRGMHSDSLTIGLSDMQVVTPSIISETPASIGKPIKEEVAAASAKGAQTVTSFARSTGLTTGEVELMRGLREYGKSKKS